jgi:hypothetical protein
MQLGGDRKARGHTAMITGLKPAGRDSLPEIFVHEDGHGVDDPFPRDRQTSIAATRIFKVI